MSYGMNPQSYQPPPNLPLPKPSSNVSTTKSITQPQGKISKDIPQKLQDCIRKIIDTFRGFHPQQTPENPKNLSSPLPPPIQQQSVQRQFGRPTGTGKPISPTDQKFVQDIVAAITPKFTKSQPKPLQVGPDIYHVWFEPESGSINIQKAPIQENNDKFGFKLDTSGSLLVWENGKPLGTQSRSSKWDFVIGELDHQRELGTLGRSIKPMEGGPSIPKPRTVFQNTVGQPQYGRSPLSQPYNPPRVSQPSQYNPHTQQLSPQQKAPLQQDQQPVAQYNPRQAQALFLSILGKIPEKTPTTVIVAGVKYEVVKAGPSITITNPNTGVAMTFLTNTKTNSLTGMWKQPNGQITSGNPSPAWTALFTTVANVLLNPSSTPASNSIPQVPKQQVFPSQQGIQQQPLQQGIGGTAPAAVTQSSALLQSIEITHLQKFNELVNRYSGEGGITFNYDTHGPNSQSFKILSTDDGYIHMNGTKGSYAFKIDQNGVITSPYTSDKGTWIQKDLPAELQAIIQNAVDTIGGTAPTTDQGTTPPVNQEKEEVSSPPEELRQIFDSNASPLPEEQAEVKGAEEEDRPEENEELAQEPSTSSSKEEEGILETGEEQDELFDPDDDPERFREQSQGPQEGLSQDVGVSPISTQPLLPKEDEMRTLFEQIVAKYKSSATTGKHSYSKENPYFFEVNNIKYKLWYNPESSARNRKIDTINIECIGSARLGVHIGETEKVHCQVDDQDVWYKDLDSSWASPLQEISTLLSKPEIPQ